MKTKYIKWLGLVAAVALPVGSGLAQTQSTVTPPPASAPAVSNTGTEAPLPANLPENVREVVKLARAGLGDEVVVAFVEKSPAPYSLSAKDVFQLKSLGVSSPVITSMLHHDSYVRTPAPDYASRAVTPPAPTDQAPSTPPLNPVANPVTSTSPAVLPSQTAPPGSPPPPVPVVETVPVSPGPDYDWAPGYWGWSNGAWIWVGGGWHDYGWFGWHHYGGWHGGRGWGGHDHDRGGHWGHR